MKKFLLAASTLLFVFASLGATSQANAQTTPNTCPQGYKPIAAELSEAGDTVTYRFASGDVSRSVLDNQVDPLSMGDSEIAALGLPSAPLEEPERSSWVQLVDSFKSFAPFECEIENNASAPSAATSGNWSGFLSTNSSTSYIGVQGDVTVPTVLPTTCKGATLASWVGLGGFLTHRLIQVGVSYFSASSKPFVFYEFLNSDLNLDSYMQPLNGLSVSAGDRVHLYTVIQTSPGKTTFYAYNTDNGQSDSIVIPLDVAKYLDGSTADWIDERITVSNVITPLLDFNYDVWTNVKSQLQSGAFSDLGSETKHGVVMTSNNLVLARPVNTLNSATSFNDTFVRCS